jgi:hypothetical protein
MLAERHARIDALVDVAVRTYAPLPAATLSYLVRRLRYAAPQWHGELGKALQRARHRLAHAQVDGIDWYWPAGERPSRPRVGTTVRTRSVAGAVRPDCVGSPALRAALGLAVPLRSVHAGGQAQARVLRAAAAVAGPRDWLGESLDEERRTAADVGYVAARPPRDRTFGRALEAELDRMRFFLGADAQRTSADVEASSKTRYRQAAVHVDHAARGIRQVAAHQGGDDRPTSSG